MTPILFLRHGPTEWNAIGRVQGHTDIPLSDEGRATVRRWRLDDAYRDFGWVASPLSRAQETARLLGATACASDPRLAEANWGDWEGRILDELRAELGEELTANEARGLDLSPPGGESPRDVCNRLQEWLTEHAVLRQPTIAVVHAGVLRAAYTLATGWDMSRAAPLRRGHAFAHLYDVAPDGRLTLRELNIALEPEDG